MDKSRSCTRRFGKLKKLVARWRSNPRDEVDGKLAALGDRLMQFQPERPHDEMIIATIEQALIGADAGNPAVGAVLVDSDGVIVH